MYRYLRIFIALLAYVAVMIIFGILPASAQQPESPVTFPPIPERPPVSATLAQEVAAQDFQAEHTGWAVRLGEQSRAPRSLLGPPIPIAGGTPVQNARQFLSENVDLFGIATGLPNLELIRTEERRFDHVLFRQVYEGIAVEGSVYSVHMTKEGGVYYASGDYFDDVQVETTSPTVSRTRAVDIATDDLGSELELRAAPETELIILPYGAEYRLVWKVTVPARAPSGRWVYYISATDGSVLGGYNDADSATADGDVYDHHPDAGDPIVPRTLTHLNGNGYSLDGSYIQVQNEDASEAYEPDGTFEYEETNTHFDEVMVYYHATEFQKYLGSEVGYLYLNHPNTIVQVQATVHVGTNSNATGATAPDILQFTDGDGTTFQGFAKESDVIAHEYLHLVTEDITFDGLDDPAATYNEENAMDEAFSDYFGGSYADSPDMGEYVYIPSGSLRDLENAYTYSDWDGTFPDEFNDWDFHNGGQIFSGALWELRQEFAENDANVLIFEGLDNLDQANPDFSDGRDAIVAAATALSMSPTDKCTIHDIFDNREISGTITSPEPPTGLQFFDGYGEWIWIEWTPSVSCNVTHYKIYRSIEGGTLNLIDTVPSSTTQYRDEEYYESQDPTWDDIMVGYRVNAYDADRSFEGYSSDFIDRWGDPAKTGVAAMPKEFKLHENFPNPFNPTTEIQFDLPETAHVRLVIYDGLGREVRRLADGPLSAGVHRVSFDASDLPSGVYVYRITADNFTQTRQMTLVK